MPSNDRRPTRIRVQTAETATGVTRHTSAGVTRHAGRLAPEECGCSSNPGPLADCLQEQDPERGRRVGR